MCRLQVDRKKAAKRIMLEKQQLLEIQKTYEMNAHNTQRQRAKTISEGVPHSDDDDSSEDSLIICPDWGCGFEGQIYSRSLSLGSSSSVSDCVLTDDSVELEDQHFTKAMDQGVFNSVHEQNRKDRKKNFEHHHHHHHRHHHSHHHHSHPKKYSLDDSRRHNDEEENESPSFMQRTRSKSFDTKHLSDVAPDHSSSRRKKVSTKHRKLRQELSNSGIDLHNSTDNMTIDEIYEMQSRFFASLKLSPDYLKQYSHEDLAYRDMPASPIHKNRSLSFH